MFGHESAARGNKRHSYSEIISRKLQLGCVRKSRGYYKNVDMNAKPARLFYIPTPREQRQK